jgi:predicted GNAT superfamily acetyltransferase
MAAGLERLREFRFRSLGKPEELRAVAELEREAMGGGNETPVSVATLRALADHGGFVHGAFADIYLAGVTAGFIGWDGKELYHALLLAAVRPAYQNHRLGFRLLQLRRDEALQQGIASIRFDLDPLRSRGARLAIRLLGARPERYRVHHLGMQEWGSEKGLETDRLAMRWTLEGPGIRERLGGVLPTTEEDRARLGRSHPIVETELSDEGLRVPSAVGEPTGESASLEIPFDLGALQQHGPDRVRPWRHAVRDAFRAALDLGYEVDDFTVASLEHERRSFYLLRKAPPAASSS